MKLLFKTGMVLLSVFATIGVSAAAKTYTVSSPDKSVKIDVTVGDKITYTVSKNGNVMIAPSEISMTLGNGTVFGVKAKLSANQKSVVETIDSPTYRARKIDVKYNQLDLHNSAFGIQFRAFDEGAAYRFYANKLPQTTVKNELAEFNFDADYNAFVPYSVSESRPFDTSCESEYEYIPLSKFNTAKLAIMPTLVDMGAKGKVLITESDLEDYGGMLLGYDAANKGLTGKLAGYPKKTSIGTTRCKEFVDEHDDFVAKVSGTRTFPWRVIAIALEDKELPTNSMVYALASPNRIGDTSWIRYGKSAWDWWNNWNISHVDFKAGINTATYKYFIDFAAKNGLEYVILDEGWSKPSDGNVLQSIPSIDLPEIVTYGKQKGVGVIIWVVGKTLDKVVEEACQKYSAMGVAGYKVDFIDRNDQEAVRMVYHIASVAAKYKMLVDFHGIYKPTGLSRTYPNVVNYEGVFGLEQLKWSNPNMPKYDVTIPFIRMVPGPMDYTQGAMRNCAYGVFNNVYSAPMSQGTRSHQVGEYVVFDSPLVMLCDSPSFYEKEPETLSFISRIKTTSPDQTQILDGKVGEYIITARRTGDKWYVGGLTDWTARTVEVPMTMLGEGTYNVEMMTDGVNSNRSGEDYKITKRTVTSQDIIKIDMARGGGFAMIISK